MNPALEKIHEEYVRSMNKFGNFCSAHEGYAILLEEVDELWDEIKKRPNSVDDLAMWREAKHVAAMAYKMMLFLSTRGEKILLICRKCRVSFTCKKDLSLEIHNLCHVCEMERHKQK